MLKVIGLYDVDGKKFPNLPLMKLSAWHKSQGDRVELIRSDDEHIKRFYDKIYVSKVFSDEYTTMKFPPKLLRCAATELEYGGTGFAISVVNGQEVYDREKDKPLPAYIEHIYPDYSLYPELTKGKAYGFLTRGCCNDCSFCIVSRKEGRCSVKVADLSEWWNGQKHIVLLDPNILACRERIDLLEQLSESGATVDFNQGLDARFCDDIVCYHLNRIKKGKVHFAFDFMKNEDKIVKGIKTYIDICKPQKRDVSVYILTNYDTTFEEDMYRVRMIQSLGICPDIRVYRKGTEPRITKWLQRWSNCRMIYHSCPDFMDYIPLVDGKTVREHIKEGKCLCQNN